MSHPTTSALRLRARALLALAALALGVITTSRAHAQEPDVRNVRPAVMLLVDTSGSMEYALNARSGSIAGRVADCSRAERDRWVSLVEVLTGPIASYSCDSVNRRTAYPGAPDQYYPLHFARPRSAGNAYVSGGTFAQGNGILDTYLERVKFGLMVYDNIYGMYTGVDEHTLAPVAMTIIVMAAIVHAGATAVIATVDLALVTIVVVAVAVPPLREGFTHGGRQHQDGGGSGEKFFHWGTFLFVPFTSKKIGFSR